MSSSFPNEKLKKWFLSSKRDLPWRQNPTPYAVWISEVMLQQTQVAVVIPYFNRWMQAFPSIEALAIASLEEVIKAWEGLGYYSRARHLHQGAQYLVEHCQGELPADEKELKKIKGLGHYTIGAILSFAFHQKKAAVDGNVLRVLARYFQIEEDIAKTSTIKKLRDFAESILPDEESWISSEALIELGATICSRKAICQECPLKSNCQSYLHGLSDKLPIKTKAIKTQYLYRAVAIVKCGDYFLVKKGKKGEIMSDLYEFPFFEVSQEGITLKKLQENIKLHWNLTVHLLQSLSSIEHGFTRYQARLDPCVFNCLEMSPVKDLEWLDTKSLKQKAFSSGHRRIFQSLLSLDID